MKNKDMEVLGTIAFLVIACIVIAFLVLALPIAIVGAIFSPCKIAWIIAFIVLKKTSILKISWWWILLGLLIPW